MIVFHWSLRLDERWSSHQQSVLSITVFGNGHGVLKNFFTRSFFIASIVIVSMSLHLYPSFIILCKQGSSHTCYGHASSGSNLFENEIKSQDFVTERASLSWLLLCLAASSLMFFRKQLPYDLMFVFMSIVFPF